MHPTSLLDLCAELLRPVLKFDAPADGVVSAFFRAHRDLGPRERHTLAETAYAVLRQRLLFQHLAQGGSGAPERRLAILGWQGREGFLQGALRSRTRQQWLERCRAVDVSDAAGQAAPQPARLAGRRTARADGRRRLLGAGARHSMQPAPLDLRVNIVKAKREAVQEALREAGIDAQPTTVSRPGACVWPTSRR